MIEQQIFMLPDGSRIVHGACRGADSIAGSIGKDLLYDVRVYPADWGRYRKGAGPIRNQQMLDVEAPDEVWAFHDDLEASKGTNDMVTRAQEQGYTVKLFSHENPRGEALSIQLSLW